MLVPEHEEPEDVAMSDKYLISRSTSGRVGRSVEVATKRRLQTRTIDMVRLHRRRQH